MLGRLSTAGYARQSMLDISTTRTSLFELQKDISSGKKDHSYEEISSHGSLERLMHVQTAILHNNTYGRTTSITNARVTQMASSINNIQELAGSLRDLIVTARNPVTAEVLPLKQLALDKLHLLGDSLNANLEGRYLFSGSKTDTKPVEINKSQNNLNSDGTPNNTYYQGNDTPLYATIQDGVAMHYNITADHPAFQQIIAAAYKAMEVGNGELTDQTQRDAILVNALDLINEGLNELQKVVSSVNTNLAVISDVKTQQLDDNLFLKQLISDETDTDIADASIQATTYQTVLQASFQVFARLSQLSLSDYL